MYPSIPVCHFDSMLVCKCASTQLCKYAGMKLLYGGKSAAPKPKTLLTKVTQFSMLYGSVKKKLKVKLLSGHFVIY